jgi:hypothetical protein
MPVFTIACPACGHRWLFPHEITGTIVCRDMATKEGCGKAFDVIPEAHRPPKILGISLGRTRWSARTHERP